MSNAAKSYETFRAVENARRNLNAAKARSPKGATSSAHIDVALHVVTLIAVNALAWAVSGFWLPF